MKTLICIGSMFLILQCSLSGQNIIAEKNEPGSFTVATNSDAAVIYSDIHDDWLVHKADSFLQHDIEMVTGKKPQITFSVPARAKNIIIVGTIDNCPLIRKLAIEKKIRISDMEGKWEMFRMQTINNPSPFLEHAFVITGSDKRGAAYGVFELSKQMGVSPWYWWADVPAKKKHAVYIRAGAYQFGPPSVKYRGIFINDEAPSFSGWTKEKFGGVNHHVYEKIFELLLRLRANYLWPAMWANAFNDDDAQDPVMADKYGIVMGTSHHEPMLRAQQEWKRYGKGDWDYTTNDSVLRAFWRKGIENMDHHESIVTLGMRGDGDKPMTQGTAINLLERIVSDQRKIIEEVTGKSASQTPQLWALYKEVQDYYDKGMRVPDDVTLLLCDDNWGNIRKLPGLSDKPRTGGYGIYYHFDYVGGPRNYKWINTNNIARVWEQMHLAYAYNVRQIWIVNVGDLKPMEFPISFFLDYAWNASKWNTNDLKKYYGRWAAEQFGLSFAKQVGSMLEKYSQYASRRKPELLDAATYSLNEWVEVVKEWKQLVQQAKTINKKLPSEYKDAFFELLLYPVKAMANLHEMYFNVALNQVDHSKETAGKVRQFYANDSLLSVQYNKKTAGGKWNHMMDQTHIGYTYWQQPPVNKMPVVSEQGTNWPLTKNTFSAKWDTIDVTEADIDPHEGVDKRNLFVERDGYVSIEAAHYTRKISNNDIQWKVIPGIGKDGDGITAFPVTSRNQIINDGSPRLEYEIYTYDSGEVTIDAYFSPTLNFHHDSTGLEYGISIDNEKPQIVSINLSDTNNHTWEQWVANNIIIKTTVHTMSTVGKHTIKYWMISPAVVLQKIVADLGGLKPGYLGPPETLRKNYHKLP